MSELKPEAVTYLEIDGTAYLPPGVISVRSFVDDTLSIMCVSNPSIVPILSLTPNVLWLSGQKNVVHQPTTYIVNNTEGQLILSGPNCFNCYEFAWKWG